MQFSRNENSMICTFRGIFTSEDCTFCAGLHFWLGFPRRHPPGSVCFAGFRCCGKDEAHKLWVGAEELERHALKRSAVLKNLDFARLSGAWRFKNADAFYANRLTA